MDALAVGSDMWLQVFALAVRDAMEGRWHARSCVAATRVGLDVLGYFGIAARPTAVAYMAFSPESAAWHDAHPDAPPEQVAPVGWSVGTYGAGQLRGEQGGREWDGHLVVVAPSLDRLLDLSIDQANRPHRGLHLPTPLVLPHPAGWWDADPQRPAVFQQTGPDGTPGPRVIYRAMTGPGARNYRDGRDWRGTPQRRAAAGDAIRRVRALI